MMASEELKSLITMFYTNKDTNAKLIPNNGEKEEEEKEPLSQDEQEQNET